jgi:purine nucleosidase/pyrimidine-specific ribonucleoside hydrolase
MKRSILIITYALIIFGMILGCAKAEPVPVVDSQSEPAKKPEVIEPVESEEEPAFAQSSGSKIPLIFSHDGAPDDIAALVYITKHPDINLLGVVNSYGEQHPATSADAWQRFLYDVIDYDTAAFGVGAEKSLDPAQNQFPSGWRDGADNFWGLTLPAASEKYSSTDGADLIIDLAKKSPEKVTILITGAHTDMALALQKDASIAENIAGIVVMGGAFNVGGNLYESSGFEGNRVAEWNIFVDPLAAKEVFTSGIPVTVVSLDGSDDFVINQIDISRIKGNSDPALSLLTEMWEGSYSSWNGNFKIWDIVAAVALTNPEHFTWVKDGLDVIAEPGSTHGQTIALNNGSEITSYTGDADFGDVKDTVFDVILSTAPQPAAENTQPVEEPEAEGSPLGFFAGTWSGIAGSDDGTFTISFNFNEGCQLNAKCGEFEIPEFDLGGDVTFTAIEGDKYIFVTSNLSEGAGVSYEEWLRVINDNELKYYSRGDYGVSEGSLKRK